MKMDRNLWSVWARVLSACIIGAIAATSTATLSGCGGNIPLISSGPAGTYEYKVGARRIVVDLDSDGSGTFYTVRSKSSGAHSRDIVWSDIGGGIINLHSSLGKGQRAAVPFQSYRVVDGGLELLDLETKSPTGQRYRRITLVTGL